MRKVKCFFENVDAVKKFTKFIAELRCNVDATYGNQVVDAKSFLGVFSLSTHELEIILHSDDDNELDSFEKICKEFEVK